MLNKNKKNNLGQNKFYHIKLRLLQFFTDATDFDNEQKMQLGIQTQATIKCAFLRDKKVIYNH